MKIPKYNLANWSVMSVVLIVMTMSCAVLAAILTDTLVVRPTVNGGSINTLLPGWTYATATIMKVTLMAGVVSAFFAMVNYVRHRWLPILRQSRTARTGYRLAQAMSSANNSEKRSPILGILSMILVPLTQLIGALTVLLAQVLVDKPEGISSGYFPIVSRVAVLVMLACLAIGAVLGVMAVFRRERQSSMGAFGVATNTFLIGLFLYYEFYKLSFDQDRWSSP